MYYNIYICFLLADTHANANIVWILNSIHHIDRNGVRLEPNTDTIEYDFNLQRKW